MASLLLTEEEKLLQNTMRSLAHKVLAIKAPQYDDAEEFPWDNIAGLHLLECLD